MIKSLPSKADRYAEQANANGPKRARLFLAWYIDPTTGKSAARWVSVAEAIAVQPLQKAA